MMLKDANFRQVINDVKARVDQVKKVLPEGVYINPVLDRSELVAKTTWQNSSIRVTNNRIERPYYA